MASHGVVARALAVLVGTFAVCLAVGPVDDPDLWFHLAAGRLMVESGSWPTVNTFSFTAPAYPWIDLHWLFQLVLYGVYRLGGVNGCIALAAILTAATTGLVYAVTRRFASPALAALLVVASLVVASPRLVPRPELVSFVLLACYLALLDGYPRTGRALYALIPLQILWTNTQGIFAIGLALIGCYWLGATLAYLPLPAGWRAQSRYDTGAWRRLTLVLVLATAACLVNPYGFAGARFPLQLFGTVSGNAFLSPRIAEFRSPFETNFAPFTATVWMALVAATAASFVVNARRWHLGRLLAATAFAYLSSLVIRNMALFAWLAAPIIAANVQAWHAGRAETPVTTRAARRRTQGAGRAAGDASTPAARRAAAGFTRLAPRAGRAAVATLLVVLIAAVATNRFWSFLGVNRELGLGLSRLRFSEEAMAFADEVGIAGRVYNGLTLGGFLLWHLAPAGKVFVDGRLEAYPEAVFRDYFLPLERPSAWPVIQERYRFDYVVLAHDLSSRLRLIEYLTATAGWALAYYDGTVAILLPGDEAHRAVRERAARAFAAVRAARRAAPPPARGVLAELRLPLIELDRARGYATFLGVIEHYEEAVEVYRYIASLEPD
jgi:hypothetical protein